eukprot:scpid49995/ scgid13444/ Calmodulin-binding transcription activator 1
MNAEMSVCVYARNANGGNDEKGRLELVNDFPTCMDRWNTNEEAARYLVSVDYHREWMSREPPHRPASGQMFIFDKREVKFKKDGYSWKRRKDGRTPREDHMRLKVFGVELLYGCYAHSADSASFHRRCYWLLQTPAIVLVHYLDVPSEDKSLSGISDTDLLQLVMSKPCLLDKLRTQLTPALSSLSASPDVPQINHSASPRSSPILKHPLQQQQQPHAPVMLEPLAHAMNTEPSPSVTIEEMMRVGELARDVASLGSRSSCSVPSSPQMMPGQHSPVSLASDTTILRQPESWPHCDSPTPMRTPGQNATILQQPHGSPSAVEILDFCPDWSYPEGGTKVVMTGTMPDRADYGLAFGDEYVPATVVQPGVLRCFCPPHSVGLVPLQLYCNSIPVAKAAVFDYKQKPFSRNSSPMHSPHCLRLNSSDQEMQFAMDDSVHVKAEPGSGFDQFTFVPPLADVSSHSTDSMWHGQHLSSLDCSSRHNSTGTQSSLTLSLTTPPESDSSFHNTISATSSSTSVGSIFDDPEAPSVAEWCEVLSDGRNVLHEDFNRLDLSVTETQQLFLAASTIQSAFRKYRRKTKEEEKQNSAAVLIQSWYRRYRHVTAAKKQETVRAEAETMAAMKIQRFLRRSMQKRSRGINQRPWSTSKLPMFSSE